MDHLVRCQFGHVIVNLVIQFSPLTLSDRIGSDHSFKMDAAGRDRGVHLQDDGPAGLRNRGEVQR